jgi:hypothetical protein
VLSLFSCTAGDHRAANDTGFLRRSKTIFLRRVNRTGEFTQAEPPNTTGAHPDWMGGQVPGTRQIEDAAASERQEICRLSGVDEWFESFPYHDDAPESLQGLEAAAYDF